MKEFFRNHSGRHLIQNGTFFKGDFSYWRRNTWDAYDVYTVNGKYARKEKNGVDFYEGYYRLGAFEPKDSTERKKNKTAYFAYADGSIIKRNFETDTTEIISDAWQYDVNRLSKSKLEGFNLHFMQNFVRMIIPPGGVGRIITSYILKNDTVYVNTESYELLDFKPFWIFTAPYSAFLSYIGTQLGTSTTHEVHLISNVLTDHYNSTERWLEANGYVVCGFDVDGELIGDTGFKIKCWNNFKSFEQAINLYNYDVTFDFTYSVTYTVDDYHEMNDIVDPSVGEVCRIGSSTDYFWNGSEWEWISLGADVSILDPDDNVLCSEEFNFSGNRNPRFVDDVRMRVYDAIFVIDESTYDFVRSIQTDKAEFVYDDETDTHTLTPSSASVSYSLDDTFEAEYEDPYSGDVEMRDYFIPYISHRDASGTWHTQRCAPNKFFRVSYTNGGETNYPVNDTTGTDFVVKGHYAYITITVPILDKNLEVKYTDGYLVNISTDNPQRISDDIRIDFTNLSDLYVKYDGVALPSHVIRSCDLDNMMMWSTWGTRFLSQHFHRCGDKDYIIFEEDDTGTLEVFDLAERTYERYDILEGEAADIINLGDYMFLFKDDWSEISEFEMLVFDNGEIYTRSVTGLLACYPYYLEGVETKKYVYFTEKWGYNIIRFSKSKREFSAFHIPAGLPYTCSGYHEQGAIVEHIDTGEKYLMKVDFANKKIFGVFKLQQSVEEEELDYNLKSVNVSSLQSTGGIYGWEEY